MKRYNFFQTPIWNGELKLDNNKLQRPIYFNRSLYIAKDNSIIKLK